jgi:hypothetical protein
MKKAFVLAVCTLFIGATAFAQSEEKKPTKEETIKWLTEKLMEWSMATTKWYKDAKISINECEIRISGKEEDGYTTVVYSTKFKEMSDCEDCERYIKYDDYGYQVIYENSSKPTVKKTEWALLKKGTTKGMAERIANAIRHLSTFCESDDDLF